jgi:hypothetical protein
MARMNGLGMLCISLVCAVSARGVETQPVSADDAQQWIRYTVPLPKEIQISSETVVPGDGVAIVFEAGTAGSHRGA